MTRRCPTCGLGPLRYEAFKKHMRRKHPESVQHTPSIGYEESLRRKAAKKDD